MTLRSDERTTRCGREQQRRRKRAPVRRREAASRARTAMKIRFHWAGSIREVFATKVFPTPAKHADGPPHFAKESSATKPARAATMENSRRSGTIYQPPLIAIRINQLGRSANLGSRRTPRNSKLLPSSGLEKTRLIEIHVSHGIFRVNLSFTHPSCQQC